MTASEDEVGEQQRQHDAAPLAESTCINFSTHLIVAANQVLLLH
jgi:hypothetical protein